MPATISRSSCETRGGACVLDAAVADSLRHAGLHRFVWDLHYPPPPGLPRELSDRGDAARHSVGTERTVGVPGTYTVRLTAGGKTLDAAVDRAHGSAHQERGRLRLRQQFALSKRLYDAVVSIQEIIPRVNDARDRAKAAGNAELAEQLAGLAGSVGGRGRGRGAGAGAASLTALSAQLSGLYSLTQDGSGPAPVQTTRAAEEALTRYQALIAQARKTVQGTGR